MLKNLDLQDQSAAKNDDKRMEFYTDIKDIIEQSLAQKSWLKIEKE